MLAYQIYGWLDFVGPVVQYQQIILCCLFPHLIVVIESVVKIVS